VRIVLALAVGFRRTSVIVADGELIRGRDERTYSIVNALRIHLSRERPPLRRMRVRCLWSCRNRAQGESWMNR
jgi:hypothetical protein